MIEQIDKLIEDLTAARPHVTKLAEAEETHEAVKADLTATEEKLEATKAALASANAGMSAAQLLAQKQHDEAIYAKQQELKGLQEKVASATAKLEEASATLASKQGLHDQLEASIESLRKRFT